MILFLLLHKTEVDRLLKFTRRSQFSNQDPKERKRQFAFISLEHPQGPLEGQLPTAPPALLCRVCAEEMRCAPDLGVFSGPRALSFSVSWAGGGGGFCGKAFHVSRKEMADNFLVLKEGKTLFPALRSKGGGKKTNPPRDKD